MKLCSITLRCEDELSPLKIPANVISPINCRALLKHFPTLWKPRSFWRGWEEWVWWSSFYLILQVFKSNRKLNFMWLETCWGSQFLLMLIDIITINFSAAIHTFFTFKGIVHSKKWKSFYYLFSQVCIFFFSSWQKENFLRNRHTALFHTMIFHGNNLFKALKTQ